jgi:hypothetical protein
VGKIHEATVRKRVHQWSHVLSKKYNVAELMTCQRNPTDEFSEKEAQAGFKAALKGALKTSPKPLKEKPGEEGQEKEGLSFTIGFRPKIFVI